MRYDHFRWCYVWQWHEQLFLHSLNEIDWCNSVFSWHVAYFFSKILPVEQNCPIQCLKFAPAGLDTFLTLFWEHSPFGQVTLKLHSPGLVFTCPKVYPAQIIPLLWSCCSHGRPTCHFAENFLILFFSYSFESRAAFVFFSFFSSSATFRTREIYFHILARNHQRNTHWSKTICLQHCWARGRPRVITSMKNSSLKPYTSRNHNRGTFFIFQIAFYWWVFVRSLQFAAKHVFFSGAVSAWVPCLPDHRWLDSYSDQQYHALCNYHYEQAIIVCLFAKPNVVLQHQFIEQFWI